MKHSVILLLLLLLGLPALGQTPAADSLRRLLNTQHRADTTRVRRLLALAYQVRMTDMPQSMQLNQQALRLARQLSDVRSEGEALLALSILYRRQPNYLMSRRYARQALRRFVQSADRQNLAKVWLQLSWIDLLQENFVSALASALRGLSLADQVGDAQIGDAQIRARLQVNIGNIYTKLGNYTDALPILREAQRNARRLGDQRTELLALNGLGSSYQELENWSSAITYHLRALQLSQKLGDVGGEASDEINLADVYGRQGDQAHALAHGLRARQLVHTTHDDYNLPPVNLMLARAYLLAHQTDSVLVLAHQALRLSQQTRSNGNIRNASSLLADAYAQQQNFEQAYYYRSVQLAYNDTLSGEDTQRHTSALRYGYELEKKRGQIALLHKTQQLQAQTAIRQRQQLYALLGGLGSVVLLAGLLLRNVFLKQRANRHLNDKNLQIAAHRDDLDAALTELKATQAQLVQREKLASLGEMTAGVAHEMQNPLNFVTNFSDLSVELLAELEEELALTALSGEQKAPLLQLLQELGQNQVKINQHGRRADRIVKSMLEHSRASSGQRQETDLNVLAEECLRLAYHGWQTKHQAFNATLATDFAPTLPHVPIVPQDLSRVILNLLTNALYAVTEKRERVGDAFQPEIRVRTRQTDHSIILQIRDNGDGIPVALREKIFQPFFTTKPTGEGTGLGLSLSYDIVTKGHGGTLSVESQEGDYTEFTISLPLSMSALPSRPTTRATTSVGA